MKERRERGGKSLREEGGSKRERGFVGWSRLVQGARKTRDTNMLLCRVSCVGILARSSCTISIQKFEVDEMYNVGRPTRIFFP